MSKNTPSSSENIYAGYLEKKGGSISSKWQKRYIFLRGDKIGYAKSPNENVLGTINRKNITGLDSIPLPVNGYFVLKVKTILRSYDLRAKNKTERDSWVDIIKRWMKGEFNDKSVDDLGDVDDLDDEDEEDIETSPSMGHRMSKLFQRRSSSNALRSSTALGSSSGQHLSGILSTSRRQTKMVNANQNYSVQVDTPKGSGTGRTFVGKSFLKKKDEFEQITGKNALAFDDSFQLKDEEAIIEEYEIKEKEYWFHIGEKEDYVDVETAIYGDDKEIAKIKKITNQMDNTDQQVLDVLHFEPFDRADVEYYISNRLVGERKILFNDILHDKKVYWSGNILLTDMDSKQSKSSKTKEIEAFIVLTWSNIIFLSSEMEEIGDVPILEVEYLLQDRFDYKKCAVLSIVNEGTRDYSFSFESSDLKIEFFHYFSSAFYSYQGKTTNIWFVDEIETFIRNGDTIRPKIVRVNPEDVLKIDDTRDYANIKNSKGFFDEIISNGDTEILFSNVVQKPGDKTNRNLDRTFILTSNAIYMFGGKNTRRIDLEEVQRVTYKGTKTDFEIVFSVPAEYDCHIKLSPERAFDILKILQDELFDGLEVIRVQTIKANTAKTAEYKEEMKKLKNVGHIVQGLKQSISNKNKKELLKFLRYAMKLNEDSNKLKEVELLNFLVSEANETLKNLNEGERSKAQFLDAIKSRNLKILFQFVETHVFEPEYILKFHRIVNEELIKLQIDEKIQKFDFSPEAEYDIMDLLKRGREWGLIEEMDELKLKLNQKIERENTHLLLKITMESNDIDQLRLAILNAQSLNLLETDLIVKEAERRIPEIQFESQVKRSIQNSKTIDELYDVEKSENFKSLKLDQKERLQKEILQTKISLESNGKKARWYSNIEDEIKKIQRRLRNHDDVVTKTYLDDLHKLLGHIPEGCQIPESVDTLVSQVNKQIGVYNKKKCDQFKPELEEAIKKEDVQLIKELLEKYKEFEHESMNDLANEGRKILDRHYKGRELSLILSIASKIMKDPYKSNSLNHIAKIVQEAKGYPHLSSMTEKVSQDIKRLQHCKKCEDILDEAMLSLNNTLIKNAIILAKDELPLKTKISHAYKLISSEDEKKKYISLQLEDALQDGDRLKIMKVVKAANQFPSLTQKVNQSIEILKSDKYKMERDSELYLLLEERLGDPLDEFISTNAEFLSEEELLLAKKKLNEIRNREYSLAEIKNGLAKAISLKDIKLLEDAIKVAIDIETDNKEMLSLLKNAKDLLQKLNIKLVQDLKENVESIQIDSDEEDEKLSSRSFLSQIKKETIAIPKPIRKVQKRNELIEEFHQAIQLLIRDIPNLKLTKDKFHVDLENENGQKVMKILNKILSDGSKKNYFQPKTIWEIFSSFKNSTLTQKYVNYFGNLEIVKKLPEAGIQHPLSFLFVHYTLHKGVLLEILGQLLKDESYLSECYEETSILRNQNLRDDLYSTLALLFQFHFQFDINSTQDILVSHPLSRLKLSIRKLVEAFIIKDVDDLEEKKTEIISIVHSSLYLELNTLFTYGFKSGFFSKIHLWDLIEEVGELKKISAMDFGGILLPSAIDKVNSIAIERSNEDIRETKLKLFIFQGLNDKALGDYIESIYNCTLIIEKYYTKNAVITQESTLEKVSEYLSLLTKLDFNMNLESLTKDGYL